MTDEFERQIEIIRTCLEQKIVLMTRMLDLTKQIEVQSREEDVEIGLLLEQRGDCIERYEKCNLLMEQQMNRIASFDADKAELIKSALLCEDCGEEFRDITESAKKHDDLFKRTREINERAQQNLVKKREIMKSEMAEMRKKYKQSQDTMFRG